MFSHDPDYTHHTSEDTPDKVDPVELERCELIATGAAWYLANLGAEGAPALARRIGARSAGRLADAAAAGDPWDTGLAEAQRSLASIEARSRTQHALLREQAAVGSVLAFARDDATRRVVEELGEELARQYDVLDRRFRTERSAVPYVEYNLAVDPRVPQRLTRGPLDFGLPESRLLPERAAAYRDPAFSVRGDARFELVNLIDGERTVPEIRNALAASFGSVAIGDVRRYLEDLVEIGVVGWR
jgi:hypothetical protein